MATANLRIVIQICTVIVATFARANNELGRRNV
jgi:hypothetical protein